MRKVIFFITILTIFTGCINKKGISLQYYDNCKESYDLFGTYKYECKDNIINFDKKDKSKNPLTIEKDCLQCN
jgi:hypothetical protein